jgi:hypothetical protein
MNFQPLLNDTFCLTCVVGAADKKNVDKRNKANRIKPLIIFIAFYM